MLQQLTIDDYVESLGEAVGSEEPLWKAWRLMKDQNLRRLPVTKNDRVVGVVSDRDIVQISGFNGGQSMPVKDAMSLDPLIIKMGTPMDKALEFMLKKDQVYAIVLDKKDQVCGIFSWDKAFQFFLEFAKMRNQKAKLSS